MTGPRRGFTLVRTYPVPPAEVFAAWTEPDKLDWFLNPGMPIAWPPQVDLRVGGAWRLHMVETADKSYVTGGIYREIDKPHRLAFTFGAVGGWPDLTDGVEDAPLVTLDFQALDRGTRMTLRLDLPPHLDDEAIRNWFNLGIEAGMSQTIDRLRLPRP
ncbi:SRPBCC family protein [Devosia aquimaris]|uniref:SRPBCC family protein n=1 Tax=Devosia aquimaris TaxID=2866214 RepID=UPI001CD16B42|nr:SRPBCC domain-containing protein [Devosia sp. CJK-A8-3]